MLKPYDGSPGGKKAAPDDAAKVKSHGTILYVEDEDQNWDIAYHRLKSTFSMHRAANSLEALRMLGTMKFDALLLDIQLSGSAHDGIEMCRIVRGKDSIAQSAGVVAHRDVPIIFVTAYSARYTMDSLALHGGDAMIAKPVDFVALCTNLSRLIVRRLRTKNDAPR